MRIEKNSVKELKENKEFEVEEEGGKTQLRFLNWNEKYKKYVLDIDEVADYFCKEYSFVTIPNDQRDVLYMFNGKYYERGAKSFIKKHCEKLLGKYAKINPITEIIAKIERRKHVPQEEFEIVDENLIPIENGIWNIKEKKLMYHSPKYYFKTIIPIIYNEDAKCPKFFKFLEEALYPEDMKTLQEWFGFQLFRKYFIKKAIILLGETDTGKTVLIDVLTKFIGDINKTGLSLQKISGGNDFVKLSLKDKHSNIYDDLSSQDLSDGGNFKVATGGGNISAEEKFGGFYQFRNYAKHTFATNKIPPVKDSDDMAYYSRWIIFRLDNPPEKKDPFLKDKLTTEEELSGMFNWALEGLYSILEDGDFSYNKTPKEVKVIMEMSGDNLIQFGGEALEQEDGHKITKENMYEIYCFWANKNKKPVLSKEQLGRRLNQKITYLISKRSKERYWENVNLKSSFTLKYDTLDSFKQIIYSILQSNKKGSCESLDMFSVKASKVTKKDDKSVQKNNKSLDKFSDEELEKDEYSRYQ